MATLTFQYSTSQVIASCSPNESEIQSGEQLKIYLKEKNPLWPEYVKAYLTQPAYTSGDGKRVYVISFDDSLLNGGPTPESCDFSSFVCWSCCDTNSERTNNLINALIEGGVLEENADGTFNYLTT